MKLILSQYLRSLKEREELDRLLVDLSIGMNFVPISKPQTGVRQYGVDLAVVGPAEDRVEELRLFIIKPGDLGRSNWDSGPQAVRQSLNDIVDVYLKTHVEPSHRSLRKRIIVAAGGDMKQDVQINWDGYTKDHENVALFEFWGADRIALLIEKHLLNENVFGSEDRTHLRKALALAGELDYDQRDLHRLFRKQLGLGEQGEVLVSQSARELSRGLRVVSLSTAIYSRWSEDEGNLKQALLAYERALLWCWHRLHIENQPNQKLFDEFWPLWNGYKEIAKKYFEKLQPHFYVKDGLSGYCGENAEFSLIVFEQIGLIASIGLTQVLVGESEDVFKIILQNANVVADALAALIRNNPVSGSPRLDQHVIDVTLGLLLLTATNKLTEAKEWLTELVSRADYTFKVKRNFPICTDSIDDLAEASVSNDDEMQTRLMRTSWLLPTLAGWSVILEQEDLYDVLARNTKVSYPEVCLQLWHPTNDVAKHLYYWTAYYRCGEAEAPIVLPDASWEYRDRMQTVLNSTRHNINAYSPACLRGFDALDLIASRHFRTPIAPYFWYRLLPNKESQPSKAEAVAHA